MIDGIKVFISHKKEDEQLAKDISARLAQNEVSSYLDVIDNQIAKDGPGLGDYIRRQMTLCNHLIAVVTRHTTLSWWVPWEIGVATEREYPLAAYVAQMTELPSYLSKWPYLRSMSDIDKYARVSKSARHALTEDVRIRGYSQTAAQSKASNEFHRQLKSELGQL